MLSLGGDILGRCKSFLGHGSRQKMRCAKSPTPAGIWRGGNLSQAAALGKAVGLLSCSKLQVPLPGLHNTVASVCHSEISNWLITE